MMASFAARMVAHIAAEDQMAESGPAADAQRGADSLETAEVEAAAGSTAAAARQPGEHEVPSTGEPRSPSLRSPRLPRAERESHNLVRIFCFKHRVG